MSTYKQLMLMVPGQSKQEDKMDFYQTLSSRGIYQTLKVAHKIKKDSCEKPEFIFSATALYMRQTAEIIHQTFPLSDLVFRDNLYTTNAKSLLFFLKHLDDIFAHLLILSENLSIQKLTQNLTGQKLDLESSCCLCIHWPIYQSWKDIDQTEGSLFRIWSP